jgi:hypothetical protein
MALGYRGNDVSAACGNAYYLSAKEPVTIRVRVSEIASDVCRVAYSSDDGRTWSAIRPWSYDNSTLFHSPSPCSTIIRHSSGRYFWIGNICGENPQGNDPDYPLVVDEIDPESLLLRRESVLEIDTCRPDDPGLMHLRNHSVDEERSTGDLVMRMTRLWKGASGHYRGDAFVYRMTP